ncbi:MAG: toprim domain-containing protein [Marinomonas sp.]
MHPSTSNEWQVYSPSSLVTPDTELVWQEKLISHYQASLKTHPDALNYLSLGLGLNDAMVFDEYRLGFVDRTLARQLPERGTLEGEMVRGYYQRLQLIKGVTGHEVYRGMIFVPILDDNGELIASFGQRIAPYPLAVRGDTHYTVQPDIEGLFFNHQVLATSRQVILCETPFDVMSLSIAGVKNAIALLDFKYFDKSHVNQLLEHGVESVTIAFSRTPIGDRYFAHVRRVLAEVGIKVTKLEMFVGESINSIWAKSLRFNKVMNELQVHQQEEQPSCPPTYH